MRNHLLMMIILKLHQKCLRIYLRKLKTKWFLK
jgi:hypothetical protein